MSSLLREVPQVIQQGAALIVAYREILASYGKVHGSDVSKRCFARWPIAIDRQRRKVDQTQLVFFDVASHGKQLRIVVIP